jgi:hypothetical protein
MNEGWFRYFVLGWLILAVVVFPLLLRIPAPYGRHTVKGWGPLMNNRLGWFLMELPALVLFTFLALYMKPTIGTTGTIAVCLWIFHYIHRVLIFPFRIRTQGKKIPILIMLFAFFFNLVNGFVNGYWFGWLSPGYAPDWLCDPRFDAGIILFTAGFVTNLYHDRILIRLRRNGNGYKIPYGGLFRFVSCPNFLGEIIEWGGFAIMTWCLPTFSFFLWTLVNLVPRALDHHRWYRRNFEGYPAERKALVPFVL